MNTLLDIPKGAEVIDVCKAVEEMMNESEERGELRMLMQLVRDGDLKLELGDIRGVTYIYGMFYRFGLINVPDEAKEKMKKAFSKSS